MKKLQLLGIALLAASTVLAQKKNVNLAMKKVAEAEKLVLLKQFEKAAPLLNEAKEAIEAATQNEKTKDSYKTWYYKALVYGKMQEIPSLSKSQPFKVSNESLMKAYELDAKRTTRRDEFKSILATNAFNYYNNGVITMNKGEYKAGQSSFENAYKIFNLNKGAFFKGKGQIDTLKSKANLMSGYCAYYGKDYSKAVTALKSAMKDPINAGESNVYLILSQTYGKMNNDSEQLATINAGKAKFPNDANIIASEINYYIDNDKSDQLISRLNEEIKKNPTKDEYYYNRAFAYQKLATKNEGKEKEATYWERANEDFKKAFDLKKDNVDYAYNTGVSFFNRGKIVNDKMNLLGTSNADIKKYDELKVARDNFFNKSEPFFLSATNIYQKKGKEKLNSNELKQYEQTLRALSQIYAITNKMDKLKSVKAALSNL